MSKTPPFVAMSPEDREAFLRWCDVEDEKAHTERQRLSEEAEEKRRLWEMGEPNRAIETAKARAEAERIADAARLDGAKTDLEIRRLRIEGGRIEAAAQVELAMQIADAFWPKLQAIGSGISAEARADRELIREELRLIAGRNPLDGTKK